MTHAEILVQDIVDYVKENYDAEALAKVEAKSDDLMANINYLLVMFKPPMFTMKFREEVLEGFAGTFDPSKW